MKSMVAGLDEESPARWSVEGLHTCRRAWKTLHHMGTLLSERVETQQTLYWTCAPFDIPQIQLGF